MLVRLTEKASGNKFWIDPKMVIFIQREDKNPMQVLLVLTISGPQGPLTIPVAEALDEAAEIVNAGRRKALGKDSESDSSKTAGVYPDGR